MIRCELICHRPLFRFSNCDEQRPAIDSKLLGDVKSIKALAASVRVIDAIPVDYYVVFSEIEAQLCNEFDFVAEAAAMRRIHDALHTSAEGSPCASPVVTPLPVAGLVSKRVLVMDYLGTASAPSPKLREVSIDDPQSVYDDLLQFLAVSWQKGKLVHGDFSPYNILWHDGRACVIDVGQGVVDSHPKAQEFLVRDVTRLVEWGQKNGLDVVLADAMYDVLNMDLSGVEQVDLPE